MKSWVIIAHIIFLPILSTVVHGQKLIYRIEHKGDSIGYMVADRVQKGSDVTYEIETKTNFSMLLNFEHFANYKTLYTNGILTEAFAENFLNDKERSSAKVTYNNGEYTVVTQDKTIKHKSPIRESVSGLYYNEPQPKVTRIFSERYGVFCELEKIGDHNYELIKPDGRKNVYFYKNGICEKVKVDIPVITIDIVRMK